MFRTFLKILLLSLSHIAISQNQYSRLRFEVMGFSNVDYVYYSKATEKTTSPNLFEIHTALGKMYNVNERRGIGWGGNEQTYNFEYGFMASYEVNPKFDIRLGVLSASVGTFGNVGTFALTVGSGQSSRAFKLVATPSFNIWHQSKHRMGLNLGLGASIDLVRNDIASPTGYKAVFGMDTLTYYENTRNMNRIGASIITSLQYYFILQNNNRVNFTFMHSLGLIPLASSNYSYGINQNQFYTEVWSNGTFVRIGIGYEFRLFKKLFGYSQTQRINGTNKYLYK